MQYIIINYKLGVLIDLIKLVQNRVEFESIRTLIIVVRLEQIEFGLHNLISQGR